MKHAMAVGFLGLVLCGCSGGAPASTPAVSVIPVAQAQTPSPVTFTPIFADLGEKCWAAADNGCVEHVSIAEDGGIYFMQLQLSPVTGKSASMEIKLERPMKLRRIDSWVGTGLGSRLESGGWFAYKKPNGEAANFLLEIDKHTDVAGEKQRSWDSGPEPILLPAGTVIQLWRGVPYAPPALNPSPCGGECAVHVRFFLYSE
jgi:hypothetical protein